ncbi:hypothetical protein B0H66DRAFT_381994 [Apodospora peruviana]|uniref:Small ribosomal subunit protein mS37 n=1 Tax=Apodospora peruviana TaxID=516989 RepID=A0AAE0HTZ6_9PEZI|nr:hypothetical protein B0H66DRAFT_381994 [Apodospora peruviana]
MSGRNPIRLPPLKVLRVKQPNKPERNPCLSLMTNVLSCWASSGHNTTGCMQQENSLRACMDAPKPPPNPSNTINYHLGRFSKHLIAQAKKKK